MDVSAKSTLEYVFGLDLNFGWALSDFVSYLGAVVANVELWLRF